MALSGTLVVDFNFTDKRSVGFAANIPNNQRVTETLTYADGTGQGQANQLYASNRTIPTGGNDAVDLAGVLTDAFGGTIAMARVKAVVIYNPAGNDPITVGGGTNAESTIFSTGGTVSVRPDGVLVVATTDATAYAITAGTADLLQVAGTVGQQYVIGLVGANA